MKSFFPKVCAWLLTLLGLGWLQSCTEYGCPYVNFDASGDVTDVEGNPIENAVVSRYGGRAFTDRDGRFSFDGGDVVIDDTIMLNVSAGIRYEAARVCVTMVRTESGDGHWYGGAFTSAEDVHVKLKEAEKRRSYSIYGRVTDSEGTPLPGVCISRFGLCKYSDLDGDFAFISDKLEERKDTVILNFNAMKGNFEKRTMTVTVRKIGDPTPGEWSEGVFGEKDVQVRMTPSGGN